MSTDAAEPGAVLQWDENHTQTFLDIGRYVVPEREYQIETLCDLVPPTDGEFNIVELCCGEGLLAEALLTRFPECRVYGYDGSAGMLEMASKRLAKFGARFQPVTFELAEQDWRQPPMRVHAVLSSLTIHHLDGPAKTRLYQDVYTLLEPDGVFVVADLVECANPLGMAVAAKAWDEAVRKRSLAIDGNLRGFEFFEREHWNLYRYPEPYDIDRPSRLLDQLKWLEQAGFVEVDVYWMLAGEAIFGGRKAGGPTPA